MKAPCEKLTMRAFVQQFKELMSDLERVFPEDVDVRSATTGMRALLSANPKMVARVFNECVGIPYGEAFDKGDLGFFLEKDYTSDIKLNNSDYVLRKIDNLRGPIAKLDKKCHDAVLRYFANLTKLSSFIFIAKADLESA
tara:strand:+ start:15771 stop:16190 length:420 start_codon:yes stop_codon:yes gene_type:complete